MNERRPVTWRRALSRPQLLIGLAAVVVLLAALLVAMTGPLAHPARADSGGNRSDLKNFQHVFVIMMENTGYNHLIGNTADAPWINAAAAKYGLATNYFGVAHPSQPNYIAATSGSTNGVTNDNDTTINVPNIVDQLDAGGKTWKAYMQSLSLCNGNLLAHACGNQLYERKHNPFVSYADVQSNPARLANIVDFSQFATDLANNTVPDYSWISPDQCNDMHGRGGGGSSDSCDFSNEDLLIQAGDTFLSNTVGAIIASSAWTGNSVIFITWDETEFPFNDTSGCCDANPGGGHVVMLVISHSNHSPVSSSAASNHYSMLATIEGGWKLGCLAFTCDTANVTPMSDLVGPQG
jgi:phosphatidylinositol-3-phosphatase